MIPMGGCLGRAGFGEGSSARVFSARLSPRPVSRKLHLAFRSLQHEAPFSILEDRSCVVGRFDAEPLYSILEACRATAPYWRSDVR